jgi:Putative threonine efflux protein
MLLSVLSIVGALAMGAISPGPSFIMVARKAALASRKETLLLVLGLGSGAFLFAVAALLGLHAVLKAVPTAYTLLKVCGGAYLVYLGISIWRNAKKPLPMEVSENARKSGSAWRAYLLGLATQLSNPKTAIWFAGVFAALMPADPSLLFYLVIPPLAFIVDAGWYTIVAFVLSSSFSRVAYLRHKAKADGVCGAVMILLGGKLISMVAE